MSAQEELFKAIGKDEALVDELREAWKQGVDAQDIASLLANKGIEAPLDQVEALLARVQKAKADELEAENLDIDELNRMAGGGDGKCAGTANCDNDFLDDPETPLDRRCSYSYICDEYYG